MAAFCHARIHTDSTGIKVIDGKAYIIHEVEEQETLYSLSKRYGTKVKLIREANDLNSRSIEISQILLVPYSQELLKIKVSNAIKTHFVQLGETVYAISRKYDVSVDDLKRWNQLTSNDLSVGQELYIESPGVEPEKLTTDQVVLIQEEVAEVDSSAILSEAPKYYHFVQTGETVFSISRKYGISSQTLRSWNGLISDNLSIGQKLAIRQDVVIDSLDHSVPNYTSTQYGSKKWTEKPEEVLLQKEEGLTGVIEGTEGTSKLLALHRDLPVGAEITVINLMNNRALKARIVGSLPNTGLNRNLMMRLTSASFKQLGIIDSRTRVQISYPLPEE